MIGFGRDLKGEKGFKKIVNFKSMEGILSYLLKEDGKTTDITGKDNGMGKNIFLPKYSF